MQAFSKPQLSKSGRIKRAHYRVMIVRYTPEGSGKFKTRNRTRTLLPMDEREENLPLDEMLDAAVEAVLGLVSKQSAA